MNYCYLYRCNLLINSSYHEQDEGQDDKAP
jgi:hypothetical protein